MLASSRSRQVPSWFWGLGLAAAILIAAPGCQPTSEDAGPTYSAKGLAREFSFRTRAIAKGIPGASTGGPAAKPGASGDGQTVEQATQDVLYKEMIDKLQTIKDKPIAQSCEDLIEEIAKDAELSDEQKAHATERLRALAKE